MSFYYALELLLLTAVNQFLQDAVVSASTTTATPSVVCAVRPVDVLFILDSSGSVSQNDFERAKSFVIDYKDSVLVEPATGFQISIIRFSGSASVQFYLNTYTDSSSLENAINNVAYVSGSTNTAAALQLARDVFMTSNGRRTMPDMGHYVIVMTDGQSGDNAATKAAADDLRQYVDTILSIGIGTVSQSELHDISSTPNDDIPTTVFTVANYATLETLVEQTVDITCDGVDACHNHTCVNGSCENAINDYTCDCFPGFQGIDCEINIDECENITCVNNGTCLDGINQFTCQCVEGYTSTYCETDIDWCESDPCQNHGTCSDGQIDYTCNCFWGFAGVHCEIVTCKHSQVDVLFLVESSISMTADDFQMALAFITDFISYVEIGPSSFQISLITFSDDANVQFYLNNYTNSVSLVSALEDVKKTSGESNLTRALGVAEEIFTSRNGGRTGFNTARCAILVTDDQAYVDTETTTKATALRTVLDKLLALAIGNRYAHQLVPVASPIDDDVPNTVFLVSDFMSLSSLVLTMVDIACDGHDSCGSKPCNKGDCHNQVDAFSCECYFGYTGHHCESEILECDSNPCYNGATCNEGLGAYSCTCAPGFTEENCLTEINECISDPCPGNSTCLDEVDAYTCPCIPGYYGNACEWEINECLSTPCVNGGECMDDVNAFFCSCLPGFTGLQCETDIDECASNPCTDDSVCVDQANSFTCECPLGFSGDLCETSILLVIICIPIAVLFFLLSLALCCYFRLNRRRKITPVNNDPAEHDEEASSHSCSNSECEAMFSPRAVQEDKPSEHETQEDPFYYLLKEKTGKELVNQADDSETSHLDLDNSKDRVKLAQLKPALFVLSNPTDNESKKEKPRKKHKSRKRQKVAHHPLQPSGEGTNSDFKFFQTSETVQNDTKCAEAIPSEKFIDHGNRLHHDLSVISSGSQHHLIEVHPANADAALNSVNDEVKADESEDKVDSVNVEMQGTEELEPKFDKTNAITIPAAAMNGNDDSDKGVKEEEDIDELNIITDISNENIEPSRPPLRQQLSEHPELQDLVNKANSQTLTTKEIRKKKRSNHITPDSFHSHNKKRRHKKKHKHKADDRNSDVEKDIHSSKESLDLIDKNVRFEAVNESISQDIDLEHNQEESTINQKCPEQFKPRKKALQAGSSLENNETRLHIDWSQTGARPKTVTFAQSIDNDLDEKRSTKNTRKKLAEKKLQKLMNKLHQIESSL